MCGFTSALYGRTLLGEGDDYTARQGEEPLGPLAGVVGFQGQTDLYHAEAQQDDTHSPDQAEDEIRQVVHHSQGIFSSGGKGGGGKCSRQQDETANRAKVRRPPLLRVLGLVSFFLLFIRRFLLFRFKQCFKFFIG